MVPSPGWTVGAGVEVALAPRWSARPEYLDTELTAAA